MQSIEHKAHIDLFSTDNLAVRQIYEEAFGVDEDVRVIPNGINSETVFNPDLFDRDALREKLGISSDDVAIFYIGRLSEEKNPDMYVEAVKLLVSEKVKNAKYFMIGDGPMRNEVQNAVFSIKDRPITYLGYQPNIAEYLAAADIFVLPSAVEGFPLSILEAMAMRVVVLATNVGAVADVITTGENGIIVDEISSKSIAESLRLVINDRKLLEHVKLRTRVDVEEKYSNAILGRNYKKLYEDLLR
jgi:glycosyltransferase involved in cell wall biosynthesis